MLFLIFSNGRPLSGAKMAAVGRVADKVYFFEQFAVVVMVMVIYVHSLVFLLF